MPRALLRHRILSALGAASVLSACVLPGSRRDPPGPLGDDGSTYEVGLALLAAHDFQAADSVLRRVASRCESAHRPAALLLLASLAEDPRNPAAAPDSAALMAARYLYRPGGTKEGRRLAEGLYVQALDHGADPGLRPDPGAPTVAGGPDGCRGSDLAGSPDSPASLPILGDRPYAMRLREAENRFDSLNALLGSERARSRGLAARSRELQAELDRIRRLLQLNDTTRTEDPPGA